MEKEWSIKFNPDKLKILRIHKKNKLVIYPYTLHDNTLRTPENTKYLSVTISSYLNWSSHLNTITNKAKNGLRFIRRNAKTQNLQLIEAAYRWYLCIHHTGPMAETPYTQNRNGSKVKHKVCSK